VTVSETRHRIWISASARLHPRGIFLPRLNRTWLSPLSGRHHAVNTAMVQSRGRARARSRQARPFTSKPMTSASPLCPRNTCGRIRHAGAPFAIYSLFFSFLFSSLRLRIQCSIPFVVLPVALCSCILGLSIRSSSGRSAAFSHCLGACISCSRLAINLPYAERYSSFPPITHRVVVCAPTRFCVPMFPDTSPCRFSKAADVLFLPL